MEQRPQRTSNRRVASGNAQTSQQPTQNNQPTPTEKASQAPSNAQQNQTAEVKNGSPAAPVKQEQPKQQNVPQKETTQRDAQQDQQGKNTNQRNNRRSNNARQAPTQSAPSAPSHQPAEAPTQPAQPQLQVVGESQQKQLEEQQQVLRSLLAYSPITWSIDQVATWLECMGFRYRKQVKRNHIDGIELLDLSIEDLEKMEIWSVGHRKKIMRAIEQLKQVATQYNVIAHAAHNVQPAAPQITVQKPIQQQSTQQPAQAQHNHRQAAPQQQQQRNENRNQVQNNNNNYEGEDDGRRPRRNFRGGRNTRNYYSSNRDNQ